jgi:hypothetical protein
LLLTGACASATPPSTTPESRPRSAATCERAACGI